MAINIKNTNYDGEVLENILTKAATGNELVQKGLIRLVTGVHKKYSIPRVKVGTILQKHKEQPDDDDSQGDFDYSERELNPEDFMAFTTFNPRTLEDIWRPFQPKGDLVFSELPPNVQNKMLQAMLTQLNFELGYHFVNGVYGNDANNMHLFNGILTRIMADPEVIRVKATAEDSMITRLQKVRKAIPVAIRNNPDLVFMMSVDDADRYDDELTQRIAKGANWTDSNTTRFKGTDIVPLAAMPDGVIVATIATPNENSNVWGAVNLQDDFNVIKIGPLTNAGERYFFKMLMKADTNTAFGDEVVLLDVREADTISGASTTLTTTGQLQETSIDPASDNAVYTVTATKSLLGAMLRVINTDEANAAKIGDVTIPKQSTVQLYYDGKNWFEGTVKDIVLPPPVTEATINVQTGAAAASAQPAKA